MASARPSVDRFRCAAVGDRSGMGSPGSRSARSCCSPGANTDAERFSVYGNGDHHDDGDSDGDVYPACRHGDSTRTGTGAGHNTEGDCPEKHNPENDRNAGACRCSASAARSGIHPDGDMRRFGHVDGDRLRNRLSVYLGQRCRVWFRLWQRDRLRPCRFIHDPRVRLGRASPYVVHGTWGAVLLKGLTARSAP